jgi:hypothetical protein
MQKTVTYWAKCAVRIDRRRLGAIAILLVEVLLPIAFLAPATARQAEISNRQVPVFAFEPLSVRFDAVNESESPSSGASRAFYPYSVIPGGAHTADELRNAEANDSIVRAHYADFVVANTRAERLDKTQAFYVSYRIGNAIFWTKNRMAVQAGEAVLSDGTNMIRARCGNRLSVVPAAPVSSIEPTPEAMESPDDSVLIASVDTPEALPLAPAPMTAILPPAAPAAPYSGIFLPGAPFFPMGGRGPLAGTPGSPAAPPPSGPPSPPIPPLGPPPTPPLPVATPEPSGMLLLAIGLSCILLLKKLR